MNAQRSVRKMKEKVKLKISTGEGERSNVESNEQENGQVAKKVNSDESRLTGKLLHLNKYMFASVFLTRNKIEFQRRGARFRIQSADTNK